ncbi:MAG: hypothetical protein RLZZ95_1188 [Pseudomonadota bacterium]
MKYLFILLVVLVIIWAIKRGRAKPSSDRPDASEAAKPSEMVTCAHCGIHLPHDEAVTGEKGVYCSTEHRTAAQDRNPN